MNNKLKVYNNNNLLVFAAIHIKSQTCQKQASAETFSATTVHRMIKLLDKMLFYSCSGPGGLILTFPYMARYLDPGIQCGPGLVDLANNIN